MKSYETHPGGDTPNMADGTVRRAAERVVLACRALSAAANDLHVAHAQSGITDVDHAADAVGAETERVCQLAEELSRLATELGGVTLASATEPAS
ncbi:MAG: hypothetical protein JWL67_1701 [Solirubrobacterales bacterium]|nr:hypothetical protein [Solirubrobacterales bacterium]